MFKTKPKSKFLSIFIAFAMVLQMLPMTAMPVYAESTNKITEIWVGSYKIWDGTTFDKGDYSVNKISYDDATHTLKLSDGFSNNGVYVDQVNSSEGTYYKGNVIRIVSTGKSSGAPPIEFNIEIEGDVKLQSSNAIPYDEPSGEAVHGSNIQLDVIQLTGSDANANLNIICNGTLIIEMPEGAAPKNKFRSLISVYTGNNGRGNFTMQSGTLNIDTSHGVSDNTQGVGIIANVATFEGDSNTTITIADNTGTTGIGVNTLVVKDNANLTVNGSNRTIVTASEPQFAIEARIFQTGGTITATAGKSRIGNGEYLNSRAVSGQLFLSGGTFIADSTYTFAPIAYEAFSIKPMIFGEATIEVGDDSSNLATVDESSDYQENHYVKITSTAPGTESGLTITDTEHVFPNIRSDTLNEAYRKSIYMLNFGNTTYTNVKVELIGANTDKFILKTFGGFSSTLSPNDTTGFYVEPNLTGGKVDGVYTATVEVTADQLTTPLSCDFSYEVMTYNQDIIRTALSAVTDGSLSITYGEDKVDAVQNYVNNRLDALSSPYREVTATVAHVSGDTYSVEGSYGGETFTKNITMNITVAEAGKYTISFEAFPGEATKTGTLGPVQATQAVNLALPTAEQANAAFAPSDDTKTFDKWRIGAGVNADLVEGGGTYIFTGHTTVFATWRDLYDYSITFNGNGGSGSMTAISVKENASTALPANGFTAPTDKMFKGWSLTANGAILTSPYTFTGNTELFAIWEAAPNVTISFDKNGGEGTMTPIVTKQNQPISLPENGFTAPAGKEFIGWLDSATPTIINGAYIVILPGNVINGLNADGTIYAIWAQRPADHFKLTITMVGGDNASSIIFAPKGTDYDLSSYTSSGGEQFYVSTNSTGTDSITSLVDPQADTTVYLFDGAPPLTGTLTIDDTTPQFGQTLNVSYAGGNASGTRTYQWKSDSDNVGTNSDSYTVEASDIGKVISVVMTTSEQTGFISSANTSAVAKADQAALSITGGTTVDYGATLDLDVSGGSGTGAETFTVADGTGKATINPNTGVLTPTQAGTITVTATKAADDNYNVATMTHTVTINKGAYTGTKTATGGANVNGGTYTTTLPSIPAGASYGTPSNGGGTITLSGFGIAGNVLTYTAPSSTVGQTGTITIPVTEATNHTDYSITVTVTSSAKDPQNVSFAEGDMTKIYSDVNFSNVASTTGDGTIGYTSGTPSVAEVDAITGEITLKDVGSTIITATATESATYATATASYTLTVGKATITITAENESAYNGTTEPSYTYTVTGLRAGESLTTEPTVDCPTVDMSTNNSYPIVASGAAADASKYDIIYVNGSLTVSNRPTGGGGGGVSSTPNTPSEEAVDDIAKAKPGDTVELKLSGSNTTVNKEVFEELAGKDITLDIVVGGVTWTVHGEDIKEGMDFSDIDLGVKINSNTIPATVINDVSGATETVQISIEHDGEFGFPVKLTVDLGGDNEGYYANLFYYNELTDELEFRQSVMIPENGKAEFDFTGASDYVFVISERDMDMNFTDVKSSDWYYEDVMYVYQNGIMTGVTDTTFIPSGNATRATIWTVLARLSGATLENGAAWYESAQNWSIENEVSDGTNPNGSITREQLVTMLFRYNNDPTMTLQTMLEQFEDSDMVSGYAVSAMEWAVANGIINGKGEKLDPQGNATRAEIAAIMHRFMMME